MLLLLFFLFWELFCLVLPPVGVGGATTGAGAELVVTGGDEDCVVADGALVAVAALALCTVAFLWALCAVFFFVVAVVV